MKAELHKRYVEEVVLTLSVEEAIYLKALVGGVTSGLSKIPVSEAIHGVFWALRDKLVEEEPTSFSDFFEGEVHIK